MYSKRLMTVMLFLLMVVIVSGCTNDDVADRKNLSEPPNVKDTGDYILNLDVLVYKETSDMPQPELSISTAKQHEILASEDSIESIANNPVTDLPEDLNVKSIYVITHSYGQGIKLNSQKHYMYVQGEDDRKFIKKFDYGTEYQMDEFTKEDIQKLLDKVGREGWIEAAERPF